MKAARFALTPERCGVTGGSQFAKWAILPPTIRRQRIAGDVRLMQQAGVRWTRVSLATEAAPTPDTDYYLGLLRDSHISVLGRLAFSTLPTDLSVFSQNIARLVRAYPHITVWEAGNEPNLKSFWKSAPEDYVPALRAVYETIKSVDARRQVACAGLSEWKVEPFIEMLDRQDAGKWMDIFAFHPYASSPQKVLNRWLSVQKVLPDAIRKKPVWITEIGFHTVADWKNNPGYVPDEKTKADYLEKTFTLLGEATQGPIFWYTFQEAFKGPTLGYGLLNQEFIPGATGDTAPRVVYSAAYERFQVLSGTNHKSVLGTRPDAR